MRGDRLSGKDRAALFGPVADRDDEIKRLALEFFPRFAAQAVGGESDVRQRLDRQGMHVPGRLGTGAEGLKTSLPEAIHNHLRHLAAAGISRAKKQNSLHDRAAPGLRAVILAETT